MIELDQGYKKEQRKAKRNRGSRRNHARKSSEQNISDMAITFPLY